MVTNYNLYNPSSDNSKFKKRRRQSILLFHDDHCIVLGALMVEPNEGFSSGFRFLSNQLLIRSNKVKIN